MRIGELSRRTGVSERALRYYEQQGLLTAERAAGGHREFDESAVGRVACVRELFAAGLCSGRIARVLQCLPGQGGRERASEELIAGLVGERDRLDRAIDELRRSRGVLDDVIREARGSGAAGDQDPSGRAPQPSPSGSAHDGRTSPRRTPS
ncbi:MerR family transcriptional regulator [Streptomyces huiliensis]|uniref:MerR family transcriptional regulator n=1 Tax=Streptomyces huiliensis TaxID=2876027 RepID=UPI001CBDE785|nr:MerR family transcriptional regulator [Streptomyces huiliensis]MBZ4323558.1 MerR family transcriptional regulator [Streptomyces huiliensis]